MDSPHLVAVTLALPESIKALAHVVRCINDLLMPDTIDAAVYSDCRYIVRTHGATRKWTTRAMDGAAARGRLDLVKWLSVVRNEGCSIAALDGAARNGHLKVVRWLCHHYIGRCSSGALNTAAINGHFDIVKWLCRHNRAQADSIPYVITYGIQAVAAAEETSTLRALLRENCSWFYVGRALEEAAARGSLPVVKLLLTVKLQQANVSRALKVAVASGQVEVVKLVADVCSSAELRAAYPTSLMNAHGAIAHFLRKTLEARNVEEKWGYFRTQHKTLERMKDTSRKQGQAVSFCGLMRSW